MKRIFLILSLSIMASISAQAAELSGGMRIGFHDDISRTSVGVSGMMFPRVLSKDRLSLGFEISADFIERFMNEVSGPYNFADTDDLYSWDSLIVYSKEYNDFLFFPFGATLRYDFGDPGSLSVIRPSLFLGFGGILNLRQKSYRDVGEKRYDGSTLWYSYSTWEYGGDSDATLDFYIKPRIALYWNRAYLSYEHYFNTEYIMGSITIGYVFRL